MLGEWRIWRDDPSSEEGGEEGYLWHEGKAVVVCCRIGSQGSGHATVTAE